MTQRPDRRMAPPSTAARDGAVTTRPKNRQKRLAHSQNRSMFRASFARWMRQGPELGRRLNSEE